MQNDADPIFATNHVLQNSSLVGFKIVYSYSFF